MVLKYRSPLGSESWRDGYTGKRWNSSYTVTLEDETVSGSKDTVNRGIDILLADGNTAIDYNRLIRYRVCIELSCVPEEARHEHLAENLEKKKPRSGEYESIWPMVLGVTGLCKCRDKLYLRYCRKNCTYTSVEQNVVYTGEIYVVQRKHPDGLWGQVPLVFGQGGSNKEGPGRQGHMVLNGGVRSYGWRWRDEHTGKIWHSPYSVRLKGEIVSGSRETENKGIDILLADSNIRIDRSRLIKYEINIALGFIPPEARHEYLAETLRKQVLGDYYKFESMWDMVLRFTELNTCKDGVYLEYCRQNCVFDANKYGVTCKGEICVAERKHRDGFYEQIPADILERKTISFW